MDVGETASTHRGIGRVRNDIDIVEGDIIRANHERRPAWRVQECDTINRYSSSIVGQE